MNASSKEAAGSSTSTQQGNNTNDTKLISKGQSSSSSQWLRLKDPRIVRVSRAFGGKDRHSKVCTIRGLRDRRVRLSVPTAIQLYDLQERLGLNQPSKVVDWLLNAAKDEIDELPPLPFPPSGTFGLNHQMLLSTSQEQGLKTSNTNASASTSTSANLDDPTGELSKSIFWNSDEFWRAKCKEVARDTTTNEKDDNEAQQVPSDHSSSQAMLSNAVSYGSYYHFEPPSFASSHLGTHGFASHTEELHDFNVLPLPLPSTLSLSSASRMLDPIQQVNHFQMLSSATQTILPSSLNSPPYSIRQSIRPFHLSIAPGFPHSHNNNGSQPDESRK